MNYQQNELLLQHKIYHPKNDYLGIFSFYYFTDFFSQTAVLV